MNQKGFGNSVIIIIGIIAFIGTASYFIVTEQFSLLPNSSSPSVSPTSNSLSSTTSVPSAASTFAPTATSEPKTANQTDPPIIQILSPSSGSVGALVTIKGSGFTAAQNIVRFGSDYSEYLDSADGVTLIFSVPVEQDACHPSGNPCFEIRNIPVTAGEYDVYVMNANGISNGVPFVVADQGANSLDCGKPTFIVIAGGPDGPYGETANTRAKEYFEANGLVVIDEGGSRFVVEPSYNTKQYWMKKVQDDGIGSAQYDNVGCDWVQ